MHQRRYVFEQCSSTKYGVKLENCTSVHKLVLGDLDAATEVQR
jgi:hypothetical protein